MQRAELVLSLISKNSMKSCNYKFERVYRDLFNVDFYNYVLSRENINYNDYQEQIESLITELRNETFKPKKHCKLTFLVEKAVAILLEAMYSNEFAETNDKFRPCSNLNNALTKAKNELGSAIWFINSDIKLDIKSVTGIELVNMLSKRIEDKRFLNLIEKFVSYYYKDSKKDKLFIEINFSNERLISVLIKVLYYQIDRMMKDKFESFENVRYIRFRNSTLIGFSGTRDQFTQASKNIEEIEKKLVKFGKHSSETSFGELTNGKLIFLNHEIVKINHEIDLEIPERLVEQKLKYFSKDNKPFHVGSRVNFKVSEIINMFQDDINRFEKTYCMASNFKRKQKYYKYFLQQSLVKTVALKEKSSVSKVFEKYKDMIYL